MLRNRKYDGMVFRNKTGDWQTEGEEMFRLYMQPHNTIRDLKNNLFQRTGTPFDRLRVYDKGTAHYGLIMPSGHNRAGTQPGRLGLRLDGGILLSDTATLSEYNIKKINIEFGGDTQPTRITLL